MPFFFVPIARAASDVTFDVDKLGGVQTDQVGGSVDGIVTTIVTFFYSFVVLLAIIAVVWATIRMITANTGDYSAAKEIFRKVAIGLFLALTAYFVVNIIYEIVSWTLS